MSTIFRWVDPSNNASVTLDMNLLAGAPTDGFGVLGDVDLGTVPLESTLLHQAPHAGAVQTGMRRGVAQARFRLRLAHSTRSGYAALMEALRTELLRSPGCIEYRPDGLASSYFIDTLASDIPTSLHGQEAALYEAGVFKSVPRGIPVVVLRQPDLRGAGVVA